VWTPTIRNGSSLLATFLPVCEITTKGIVLVWATQASQTSRQRLGCPLPASDLAGKPLASLARMMMMTMMGVAGHWPAVASLCCRPHLARPGSDEA
jgi:hypothetical protein